MAESRLSSLVERIGELLTQEAEYLLDVEDQFNRLQRELRWMKSFLKEADSRQAEDERIRMWVSEIRDIAYEAEDVIDTLALEAASKRKGGSYGIRDVHDGEGLSSSSKRQDLRQSYPHIVETNVVGFDKDIAIAKLVSVLVDEGTQLRVASICGMGGLGKTTLAKKVFHHGRVRNHFKYFVWAYVSQQCQRKMVWKGISASLGLIEDKGGIPHLEEDDQELAGRLYNFLKENKCLVVLDDIWSTHDWEAIRPGFPMEETNSKMLLTIRNKDVALHIDLRGWLHELQCLTDEDSLKLFQSIAFPRSDSADHAIEEKMLELGKDMVKHCAGLPLAVVVLVGILARKYSVNEWITVHENVESYLKKGRGCWGVSEALALSYDDMPVYLKPCFLYLSIFPEDYEIPATKLIQLWVAEDLVLLEKNVDIGEEMVEEVAEDYLNELAERYMVQVRKRDARLKIKTCRMHDLVRDLCLSKAQQESFLHIIDPLKTNQTGCSILPSCAIDKVRRLAIHKSVLINGISNPHLRSLLFFDDLIPVEFYETFLGCKLVEACIGKNDNINVKVLGIIFYMVVIFCQYGHKTRVLSRYLFNNFKQLRVLSFDKESVAVCKVRSDIGCLIHLRFLSLGACSILGSTLPSSLCKLRCLITLDLSLPCPGIFAEERVHVPDVLWMMEQLRHLYLPQVCDRKTKLKLGNLRNLQTLVNFNTKNCYLGDIFCMKNLKELRINTPFNVVDFREDLNMNLLSKHLRSLSVKSDERIDPGHLTYFLSVCLNIYELSLSAEINKLPEHQHFSPNIAYICLSGSRLDEDPMPTLEKRPKLKVLKLKAEVFIGIVMTCSANGFPQLESLSISAQGNLEELRVNQEAMSNLRYLKIVDCRELKMLPDGLTTTTVLRELKIKKMPKAFEEKLVQGGQDYYKIQHVPSVIFQN
ncbi:hypothetical protein DITRI_Ditri07aG0046600 [Diplodiscus trichospermus]